MDCGSARVHEDFRLSASSNMSNDLKNIEYCWGRVPRKTSKATISMIGFLETFLSMCQLQAERIFFPVHFCFLFPVTSRNLETWAGFRLFHKNINGDHFDDRIPGNNFKYVSTPSRKNFISTRMVFVSCFYFIFPYFSLFFIFIYLFFCLGSYVFMILKVEILRAEDISVHFSAVLRLSLVF